MKRSLHLVLLFGSIAGAFLAGAWYTQRGPVKPLSGVPPQAVHAHGAGGHVRGSTAMSPASMEISAEKQQLLGVRVTPVEKASRTQTLRIFGRVAPDETRIYRLNAGVEGVIREVSTVTTGSQVKKGQWLATVAAPDAIAWIQAYIVAFGYVDRMKQTGTDILAQISSASPTSSNYQQRIEKLQTLGLSDGQIEDIGRKQEVPHGIKMLAPADGFVLALNVSPGLKFDRGVEFYRIADLRRVWILADVFRKEAQYLRPGVRAKVSLPDEPTPLTARVAEILPQFDATTRTLKVRLEADNPGYVLRPDMFVDVELPITLPSAIAVPADAVFDSGVKQTVFVDRGNGSFEAREVETGWRLGDRVEIVKGLTPGERIVVAGAFLLDSESRMRSARGATAHAGHDHGATAPAGSEGASSTAQNGHAAHDHAAHDHETHDHGGHR